MKEVLIGVLGGVFFLLLGIIFKQKRDLSQKEQQRQELATRIVSASSKQTEKNMEKNISANATVISSEMEELHKAKKLALKIAKDTVPVVGDEEIEDEEPIPEVKSYTESIVEDEDEEDTAEPANTFTTIPLPPHLKRIAEASAMRVKEHEANIDNLVNGG